MYAGAAIPETPTPTPPINLNNAKVIGSFARAEPIADPQRCSIGFHPLHSEIAITIFALMLIHKKLRIFGFGLLIHMSLDGLDCTWMASFSPGISNS